MTEKNFKTAHQRFAQSYDRLFALLADYPADKRDLPGACGEWSAREVAAHFAGWLEEGIRQYDAILAGGEPTFTQDLDGFNAQSVASRAGLDWAATIADLKDAYARFNQTSLSLEDGLANQVYTFTSWQLGLARDCKFHTEQLEAFATLTAL